MLMCLICCLFLPLEHHLMEATAHTLVMVHLLHCQVEMLKQPFYIVDMMGVFADPLLVGIA